MMETNHTLYNTGRYLFILARLWTWLALAFMAFMIGGHIFGTEPQVIAPNEWLPMVFFPAGVFLGLLISLRFTVPGALIALISMSVFFVLHPPAIAGIWFWLLLAPALLHLLHRLIFVRS